jgi:DNA gyrase subunit B
MLIQSALTGASLYPGDGQSISGSDLEQLVSEYTAAMNIINRFSKRYPKEFLEALMYAPFINETQLAQREEMEKVIKNIQDNLAVKTVLTAYYEVELSQDPERHWWLPNVNVTSHGVTHKILINKDLFLSPDYRKLTEMGAKLNQLLKSGAYIQREEKKQTFTSFAAAMSWLIAEAKKGQSIQRYKGLGEMNPDQLWETTMDPERRCMLQVKVEDAVAADQIFTTLMGDEVEPRRQFIESNALDVVNLDI